MASTTCTGHIVPASAIPWNAKGSRMTPLSLIVSLLTEKKAPIVLVVHACSEYYEYRSMSVAKRQAVKNAANRPADQGPLSDEYVSLVLMNQHGERSYRFIPMDKDRHYVFEGLSSDVCPKAALRKIHGKKLPDEVVKGKYYLHTLRVDMNKDWIVPDGRRNYCAKMRRKEDCNCGVTIN